MTQTSIQGFLTGRLKGMRYALQGFHEFFRTQHAAWAHLMGHTVLAGGAWLMGFSASQWLALILIIVVCFVAELLNTAIECVSDALTTDHHPLIGRAKDLGAAAVCLALTGEVLIYIVIIASNAGPR